MIKHITLGILRVIAFSIVGVFYWLLIVLGTEHFLDELVDLSPGIERILFLVITFTPWLGLCFVAVSCKKLRDHPSNRQVAPPVGAEDENNKKLSQL